MSREREFHEWIEQQNREEKDAVWAKIQRKEAERGQEHTAPLPKARSFSWKKWAPIAASSLAVLVVGVFATWGFLSLKEDDDNKGRYFTGQSYETVEAQYTLKEYAQGIGENLLYFDWYEETEDLENYAWQVTDTQEVICFQEEMVDINTGCRIYMYVMESNITIEGFSVEEETDRKSEIKGIQIDWRYTRFNAYANFIYDDYKYYLRVDEPMDENYILDLIETLLA